MDDKYSQLGKRMAKGALWSVLMRFAVRSIGLVSTIVLARLLVPADFGLVVLATMLVAFLELLSELQLWTFLIVGRDVDRSYCDTAWTLSLLRGGMTAIALVISASFAADFFAEPRLEHVIYALALACVIDGLANIGVVDFYKSLTFERDFRLLVGTKLVSFAVTVLSALLLRNYWALVIGKLSGSLALLALSYAMHPYRPRFCLARTREIVRFSKWLLANNLLDYAQRRSYALFIGKILDATSLGLYSLAREVSALATSELAVPIQRVLLPGLSTLADDPKAMRRTFLDGLAIIVMLTLPVTVGIALVADPLVRVVMGSNWLEAIPVMQVLVVAGIARVCSANSDAYLLTLKLPHLTTVLACFGAVVGVLSMLWATSVWGLIGAAWAAGATAVIQLLLNYAIIWRATGISPKAVGAVLWRSIGACLAMSVAVLMLLDHWPRTNTPLGPLWELCCASLVGAATYVVTHLGLWRLSGAPPSAERHALRLASAFAARLWSRRGTDRA
jgi:O-antigen/teichoic acid export membrane protein